MNDWIAVAHCEFLTDEQPLNARAEHGPLLVEQGRLFRCRIGFASGQAFTDVYEYVLDFAFGADQFHFIAGIRTPLVELAAFGGKLKWRTLGLRTVKLDDAGDVGEKVLKWFGALRPTDLDSF